MFKIIIKNRFRDKLDDFLLSYTRIFKSLYSDTWIINEELLFETYEKSAKQMKNFILAEIDDTFSIETIFWYKLYGDWQKSVKIFLKSFMLEIFYEEDLDEKIRFIENIKISKK